MRMHPLFLNACSMPPLLVAALLAGCSGSDTAANAQNATNAAASAVHRPADISEGTSPKADSISGARQCGNTEFERATCMIELILADLKANYRHVHGGGITSIKAGDGMSYSIALPQEERTDIFTYEFEVRGNQIRIKSKNESTESY